MSIRPIDFTVSIQKSTEVPHNESGSGRPEIAQQHFASELQKLVEQEDQTVVDRNKAEAPDVDKDGKGQGGANRPALKKRQKKKDTENKREVGSGSMLDISI